MQSETSLSTASYVSRQRCTPRIWPLHATAATWQLLTTSLPTVQQSFNISCPLGSQQQTHCRSMRRPDGIDRRMPDLVGWSRVTPHSTQYRSFRRRSSQPITWLILTNKTVQENTDKQTQYKSEKVDNLKYSKTEPGSVASYNTRPGNEVGLFYTAPEPTRGRTPDSCIDPTLHTMWKCQVANKKRHVHY